MDERNLLPSMKGRSNRILFNSFVSITFLIGMAGCMLNKAKPVIAEPNKQLPIGTLEEVTENELRGWACDPDDPDASIEVVVFQYGGKGEEFAKVLGRYRADKPRGDAVQHACHSTHGNYGFSVEIPPHNPADLFYVYAINIPGGQNNPNLLNSPLTSAPFKTAHYRAVSYEGSKDRKSTGAVTLPKLVSDGEYIYSLLAKGSFEDEKGYPGFNGIMEVRRQKIGAEEGFITIWSKSGVRDLLGALVIDRRGALHVFYYKAEAGAPSRSRLRYEKAENPRTREVSFIEQPTPDNALCSTCRLGLMYDRATDTLHVVYDTPEGVGTLRNWYTQKKVTEGQWTPKEQLQVSYKLPDGRFQYFYYPKIILFKGKIHVFTTANVFDANNTAARFFNGIKHFYKDLNGIGATWNSEWIKGPIEDGSTAFLYDAYITRTNQLALVTSFSAGLGRKAKEMPFYLSSAGFGDWSKHTILPYVNAAGCVERTLDGMFHLFYGSPSAFLNYAKSADGINWQFFQLKKPSATMQQLIIDFDCMGSQNSAPLHNPSAIVTGFTTSQSVDYSKLPKLLFPQGHSVIFVEIPEEE